MKTNPLKLIKNWHPQPRLCPGLSLTAILLFAVSSSDAQTLLSDNFNTQPGDTADFNNGTALANDQAGILAPLNYTINGDWECQRVGGSLLLAAWGVASPNHDFSLDANAANRPLTIQYDGVLDPNQGSPSYAWLSFSIGSQQSFMNSGGSAFGLNPTLGGGGNVWVNAGSVGGFSQSSSTFKVVLSDTAGTGSAFNGNGSMAELYNGTTLLGNYALSQLGAGQGYVSFRSDPYDGWSISYVDNLSVSIAPVPEPSTAALSLLGGLCCLALKRRKKD